MVDTITLKIEGVNIILLEFYKTEAIKRREKMALAILSYVYLGMGLVSILGIALLYFMKSQKAKRTLLYCLAVWAIIIAFISSTALPKNYVLQKIITWGIGLLSMVGIVIDWKFGKEKQPLAYGLVVASVILGMGKMLFF